MGENNGSKAHDDPNASHALEKFCMCLLGALNPSLKPTTAQCWVRFLSLPQEYWRPKILFAIANSLGTPVSLDAFTRFVDSNTLRTIVDGEVISIDKVQPEDRCPPIIDNMEGAVTHEEIATPEHIHETLANHEDHGNRNHKDHETQKQQANTGSQQPIHENESLLVPKMQMEETSIAQPAPNHEVDHGSGVEGNLHQVDLDSYTISETQLPHVVIDDMKKIKQAWANRES
ncbi:uncharacterized protein LOC123922531 [Trifolium pratense]|uniref:uncharacterized protein LOC123922531 n=1 Tax=Trifolium pratense TaxID=57577 RepID=UPI001E692AE4|nr:uncharacterized protein LOC123922531 [Trifolium pratense]